MIALPFDCIYTKTCATNEKNIETNKPRCPRLVSSWPRNQYSEENNPLELGFGVSLQQKGKTIQTKMKECF